jgi:hypothetical protein
MTTLTIPTTRVISEVLDGEAIIIDSLSGAYFTLDTDGTVVWEKLQAGATSLDSLVEATGLAAGRVSDAVAELAAAGLLEIAGAAPAAGGDSPSVLTKYTDMEELLLLDPIHDVDPAGWPVLPTDA